MRRPRLANDPQPPLITSPLSPPSHPADRSPRRRRRRHHRRQTTQLEGGDRRRGFGRPTTRGVSLRPCAVSVMSRPRHRETVRSAERVQSGKGPGARWGPLLYSTRCGGAKGHDTEHRAVGSFRAAIPVEVKRANRPMLVV